MHRGNMIIRKITASQLGQAVRMCAQLEVAGQPQQCWFEYPAAYQEYLCTERCDAFVIALLPYAMKHGLDIQSDIPLSEQLYYQINVYYIPVLSKYQKEFQKISLTVPTNSANLNCGHGVGTGISCGVDSFYTITTHLQDVPESYRLTHLVSMNVGSFGYQGGDFSYQWFQKELVKARSAAQQLNLPLIEVNSNLMEVYQENHAASGTFRMVGAMLGLQKLFGKYYISAGFDIKDFNILSDDNDDYDLFNLMVGSNESITFYSVGMEASRYERTAYITNYPVTFDTLTVCMSGADNCGKCEKCLRTLGTLYMLGKLDCYQGAFDTAQFLRHKIYNLAKIRYYAIGYLRPLYADIINEIKHQSRLKYMLYTLLAVLVVCPMEIIKKLLKSLLSPSALQKLKQLKAQFI